MLQDANNETERTRPYKMANTYRHHQTRGKTSHKRHPQEHDKDFTRKEKRVGVDEIDSTLL